MPRAGHGEERGRRRYAEDNGERDIRQDKQLPQDEKDAGTAASRSVPMEDPTGQSGLQIAEALPGWARLRDCHVASASPASNRGSPFWHWSETRPRALRV